MKWDPAYQGTTPEVYRRLTLEAARRGASHIVWPETAVPTPRTGCFRAPPEGELTRIAHPERDNAAGPPRPGELEDRQTVLATLSILLKIPYAELDRALAAPPADSPWPVRVRRGLTFQEVAPLEERRAGLPGVTVALEPRRAYPSGRFAAHLRAWLPGDTANVAIGQGRVLVTPLQVARFMAAIANGGILWRPRLVQRVESAGETVLLVAPEVTGHVAFAPAVLAVLRRSLWATLDDGGTASAARSLDLLVAGKTGTAQIIPDSDSTKGQDHAWFAGYAAADAPRMVVVALVERGGMGGRSLRRSPAASSARSFTP